MGFNGIPGMSGGVIDNPPPIVLKDAEAMAAWRSLLDKAAALCNAPVSNYRARAVVIGDSGRGYVGANQEFKGGSYADTIHAEQFALSLARHHGEKGIRALVVSAEPCGHCRQFMLEAGQPQLPVTYLATHAATDAETGQAWRQVVLSHTDGDAGQSPPHLLHNPFTLASGASNMYRHAGRTLAFVSEIQNNALAEAARNAAEHAFAYSAENVWAGISLETDTGQVYTGSLIESAAYNPSLPPLQDALIALIADGRKPEDVRRAVLVEPKRPGFSFADASRALLGRVSPKAGLDILKARTAHG